MFPRMLARLRPPPLLSQTRLACTQNGLRPVGDLELTEDVGGMIAHRFQREIQLIRNFLVALTLCHQRQQFCLPLREARQDTLGCARRRASRFSSSVVGGVFPYHGIYSQLDGKLFPVEMICFLENHSHGEGSRNREVEVEMSQAESGSGGPGLWLGKKLRVSEKMFPRC